MNDENLDWVQVGSRVLVARVKTSLADGIEEALGFEAVKLVLRNGSGKLVEVITDGRGDNYTNVDGKMVRPYGIDTAYLMDPDTDDGIRAIEYLLLRRLFTDLASVTSKLTVTTINVDGPGQALVEWDQAVEAMEKIRTFQNKAQVAWRVPGYPMMASLRKAK